MRDPKRSILSHWHHPVASANNDCDSEPDHAVYNLPPMLVVKPPMLVVKPPMLVDKWMAARRGGAGDAGFCWLRPSARRRPPEGRVWI